MDLVQRLAGAMGVAPAQAEAVAGLFLGTAQAQAPADEAAKLAEGVPELGAWMDRARAQVPTEDQEGVMDDVARFATSGLGGSLLGAVAGEEGKQKAQAVALLGSLGLQPSHAALAAPVLLSFLEQRLGKEWSERLLAAAPILAGLRAAQGGEGGGGVMGALGGLFGR